jgi:hypothetical protein
MSYPDPVETHTATRLKRPRRLTSPFSRPHPASASPPSERLCGFASAEGVSEHGSTECSFERSALGGIGETLSPAWAGRSRVAGRQPYPLIGLFYPTCFAPASSRSPSFESRSEAARRAVGLKGGVIAQACQTPLTTAAQGRREEDLLSRVKLISFDKRSDGANPAPLTDVRLITEQLLNEFRGPSLQPLR